MSNAEKNVLPAVPVTTPVKVSMGAGVLLALAGIPETAAHVPLMVLSGVAWTVAGVLYIASARRQVGAPHTPS